MIDKNKNKYFLSLALSFDQVTDTNDNPPAFAEPAYSFDIPENAPRGYQVGIINAIDPDVGNNAIVTYTVISDWGNDVFSLNPQTGVFTLTARLDYEEVRNHLISFYLNFYIPWHRKIRAYFIICGIMAWAVINKMW